MNSRTAFFNLNRVATGMLESAIKYASDSECTSERVSSLQKHATFTLNLRKNVINRNFAILQSELEGIQNNIGEDYHLRRS